MKILYIWNYFFFINFSFFYDVFQIIVDMYMIMELGVFGLVLILKKNYFFIFCVDCIWLGINQNKKIF